MSPSITRTFVRCSVVGRVRVCATGFPPSCIGRCGEYTSPPAPRYRRDIVTNIRTHRPLAYLCLAIIIPVGDGTNPGAGKLNKGEQMTHPVLVTTPKFVLHEGYAREFLRSND